MGHCSTSILFLLLVSIFGLSSREVDAGMPAPLPSNWTKENPPPSSLASSSTSRPAGDARLQAISFFVTCLLLSAWGVQRLWLVLRRDLTWLPVLGYWRSLSLVVLWGLLFVIVLTMISGARELMTPGAWRKQGWTYKLSETSPPPVAASGTQADRRAALERLRLALWQYAATHQGQFPASDDPAIEATLWQVPAQPGLKFTIIPDRSAEETGRLLVFEPAIAGDERLVLLTNGMVGTMPSAEIQQVVTKDFPRKAQEE
jgi:hypothetical protein